MKPLKLGIQVYSVREEADRDLKATFHALAEMGYEGVELAGFCGHTPQEVRSMAEEEGLTIISAHVGLAVFLNDGIEQTVSTYRSVGCRYIGIPYLGESDRPNSPTFASTAENLTLIAKECKKQGISLLYHNHDFEFARTDDGRTFLEVLYECAPDHLIGTEIDTCWAHIVGEDPAKLILKYSGRAPLVHLKDYKGDRDAEHYRALGIPHTPAPDALPLELQAVGHGVQNIPALLDAAVQAGTEWVIVEQDFPAAGYSAPESAKMSAEYLKNLL